MAYVYPGLVFIHIPKTGGTSVWWHFQQVGGWQCKIMHSWKQHESAGQFDDQVLKYRKKFISKATDEWRRTVGNQQKMALEYHHYEKFALVRNPFSRAVSIFTGNKSRRLAPHVWTPSVFEDWLVAVHARMSWRSNKAQIHVLLGTGDRKFSPFRNQGDFVKGDVRVFKLEEIDAMWDWLILITGPSDKTHDKAQGWGEHYHNGKPPHYREFYTDKSRKMIELLCRDDLERWEYAF